MIQFHVFESAIRAPDRPAGVLTPERANLPDCSYRHLTEFLLDVIRKETFGVDIGQDSGLTVEEYERFLPWLRQALEQHVQSIGISSRR